VFSVDKKEVGAAYVYSSAGGKPGSVYTTIRYTCAWPDIYRSKTYNGSRQINPDKLHQICQEFGIVKLKGMIQELIKKFPYALARRSFLRYYQFPAIDNNSCAFGFPFMLCSCGVIT
jgi:hypothetical protein